MTLPPPNEEIRLRQRGIGNSYTYFRTVKKLLPDGSRSEEEVKISQDDFLQQLNQVKSVVTKTRYCFLYKNQYFELDIYPNIEEYAILEIELPSYDTEVEFPPFIDVIKDVTFQKEFSNFYMSKMEDSSQWYDLLSQ